MFSGTGAEVCAQARAEGLDVLEPTMDTLVRHLQDACADFDPASHPSTPHDKHGWMDPYIMRVFNKLHASAPLLIVEVGSWKGQSAIAFAKHLQTHGPAHRLLCVDVRRSMDCHRAHRPPPCPCRAQCARAACGRLGSARLSSGRGACWTHAGAALSTGCTASLRSATDC